MTLEEGIKRIERYLRSSDYRPRFINLNNVSDLERLKSHFRAGSALFLDAERFMLRDELPNFDSLLESLSLPHDPIFLIELTTGARLLGQAALKNLLNEIAHYSKLYCRVVVVCYQCEDELAFSDPRLSELVYLVTSDSDSRPKIVLISEDSPTLPGIKPVDGIHHIPSSVEGDVNKEPLYVRTKKTKASFASSQLSVTELRDTYDLLCMVDPHSKSLLKSLGTQEQWDFALKEVSKYGGWPQALTNRFGNISNLEWGLKSWNQMDSKEQWFYFIALKLYGAEHNWCLNTAIRKAETSNHLIKELYRCLLQLDHRSKDFHEKYRQRKELLLTIDLSENEAADYCAIAMSKGKDALHFLTDNTIVEKEHILKLLDQYGLELDRNQVLRTLALIYPDLHAYLQPRRFEHELLSVYFQTYTYAKAINKVLPDLIDMMEDQAIKRDYNTLLKPRSEVMSGISKENTTLFFVDAMGAEFVSYIEEKCYQKRMRPKVHLARCNLPSITSANKEFLDGFDKDAIRTVREIDEVKHQGKENYDYSITKLPLHLIKEMEIIDKLLDRVSRRLRSMPGQRVLLVADHGATRMAVIMENTISIDVNSKGTNSGRVCEYNEDVSKIPQATEVDGYYVLANYDRFKGGRKAAVEAHGGATLEEVTVPIIELTPEPEDLEIIVKTPVIQVSNRKKAEIVLFSKTPLEQVTAIVQDKTYHGESEDQHNFVISMPDVRRSGDYVLDVYVDRALVWRGLKFSVEKEGFKENALF